MRDRAGIWIALSDLLLCVLAVVIVQVSQTKAKTDGLRQDAQYLITADWRTDLDSDVDLWVVGPSRKPAFFGSRQVGCAFLDHDSIGFATSRVVLADGSVVVSQSNKETTTIRCVEPGRWDIGVNLYSDREIPRGRPNIPVHVEVIGLNPQVTTLFSGDVALERKGQTINTLSFDMGADGKITLVSPPLAPVTDAYTRPAP